MNIYEDIHPSIERIKHLRNLMSENNIDWVVIYTEGPHLTEGLQECDKLRHFISGFTGSAGTLAVSMDSALLWTDSRYYVQAEIELRGSEIILMKYGMKGVPGVGEYISEHIWSGQTIGIDFRTISESKLRKLKKSMGREVEIINATGIMSKAFTDKPKRVFNTVRVIADDIAGASTGEKIGVLRKYIEEKLVEEDESYTFICSDPCSVMWLLNLRGEDIDYTPAAFSYMMIDSVMTRVYLNKKAVDFEVREKLSAKNIILKEYGSFYSDLDEIATDSVVIDAAKNNAAVFDSLSEAISIIEADESNLIKKHIKNPKEIDGMKKAHLEDARVMISFIRQIKEMAKKGCLLGEYETGQMLDNMRISSANCRGLSFETICAYGSNAAIVHYSAAKDNSKQLQSRGFLLVDSGGQYDFGTTDITRTISLGELTEEERKVYTLVLKGNLNLMSISFKPGIKGSNLDILARKPIWDGGYDYGHGTGHGIGCALACHEDPVRISYRAEKECELSAGNIVSDEPGIYLKDKFGVRIENALLVVDKNEKEENPGLGFEPLTLVPFDVEAIDTELLKDEELDILNEYHKRVYNMMAPLLDEKERNWLESVCSEIKR